MRCDRVRKLLSAYIDGQIDPERLRRVEEHLESCEACRRELFDLRQSVNALSETPLEDPGARFNDQVLSRLRDARQALPGFGFKLALGFAAACLVVAAAIPLYVANLERFVSRQDVYLIGQDRLIAGAPASMRVVVANRGADSPVEGARVTLALRSVKGRRSVKLMSGRTDEAGTLSGSFRVPDGLAGDYRLTATASSGMGSDSVSTVVSVERVAKILLTTDKPVYQPGQTIHVRSLSLLRPSLKPAGDDEVKLVIEDPKGNKVFQRAIESSRWGIAAADFQLGDEIGLGRYKITASLGETDTQKIVTVKRYVLPKFKVEVETDRTYYLPGQTLKGVVTARYFFGKPAAGARMRVSLLALNVRFDKFAEIKGVTDAEGVFTFDAAIPKVLAGQPLDKGSATVRIVANVVDTARHTEEITRVLPVASEPIRIAIVPESGQFAPGLENVVYVVTSYPDGRPAGTETALSIGGATQRAKSDALGVSEFRLTPPDGPMSVRLTASTADGLKSARRFDFDGALELPEYARRDYGMGPAIKDAASLGSVLIRADKAIYDVGDTAEIVILSTRKSGPVYLDVVLDSQTVLTRTLYLKRGRAEIALDLSNDYAGSVTFSAYVMSPVGVPVRDTATCLVRPAGELNVQIAPDKSVYRPGEKASIGLHVTGKDRRGVAAAIGVNIVDESVFSVEEQAPGLAALYFALQEEILKPRYQTKFAPASQYGEYGTNDYYRSELLEIMKPRLQTKGRLPEWGDATAVASMHDGESMQRAARIVFASAVDAGEAGVEAVTQKEKDWQVQRVQSQFDMAGVFAVGALAIFLPLEAALAYKRRHRALLFTSTAGLVIVTIATVLYLMTALSDGAPTDGLECFTGWTLAVFAFFWVASLVLTGRRTGYVPAVLATLGVIIVLVMILFPVFGKAREMARSSEKFRASANALVGEGGSPSAAPDAAPPQEPLGLARDNKKEIGLSLVEHKPATAGAQEPPCVRQFFPETLYSNPAVITDESGVGRIDLTAADSITRWRISALASSMNGQVGSANAPMRVFQEFFVDLDLPVGVTQGDAVSVPVAVYNYQPTTQKVSVSLRPDKWFRAKGPTTKTLELKGNEVGVVYFPLTFVALGRRSLTVEARSRALSDAIRREVTVYPNGQEQSQVKNGVVSGDTTLRVNIPKHAIPGASKLLVKVYPGVFSQVVNGLDALLQVPYGCFEQTSSVTYPNVLILKYLQATKKDRPEISMKAEQYISVGYQRLLTFEVNGGGFDWFGEAPANTVLSAYGIMELADMADVSTVDRGLIQRALGLLQQRQKSDGSWNQDHSTSTWDSLGSRLALTSYVTWALAEGGFAETDTVNRACGYVRRNIGEQRDPYVLALAANALVASGDEDAAEPILDRLAESAHVKNGRASWTARGQSLTYGGGAVANTETTALAAYAFLKSDTHPDTARQALAELIATRDTSGSWSTTQATILALKALVAGASEGAGGRGDVEVIVNGRSAGTVRLSGDDADVMSVVDASRFARAGRNVVELRVKGRASPVYQVVAKYYAPWSKVSKRPAGDLNIDVSYGRLRVEKDGVADVTARVSANRGTVKMAIVDLGLPPGFAPVTEDLDALRAKGIIERYEVTPRQIIFYLRNIKPGHPLRISYKLRALYPVRVVVPAGAAYDYYNPEATRSTVRPIVIEAI
ncbi:MAG: MG2 domain-containing protein [Armatimonadota bacterium]|nr:MG2 domain-containing protein [Armatimonadota bacterium]